MRLASHLMKRKCSAPKTNIIRRGPRRFKCSKCPAKYNSELQLAVHYHNEHIEDDDGAEDDTQEVTQEMIRDKNLSLLEVFRMHTPSKGYYQCKVCSKYLTMKTFVDHLRLHTGDFLKYCKICNRGFNSSANYSIHMNRHKNNTNVLNHLGRPKTIPGQIFTCIRCKREYKTVKLHISITLEYIKMLI